MSSTSPINVILMDDHTTKELPSINVATEALKIYLSGNNQNFNSDLRYIEKCIGHKIHPLIRDLYYISLAVYFSDLQFQRTKITEGRLFNILISVSNKDRWDNVKDQLEATLDTLTGDHYSFNFIQGKGPFQYAFSKKSNKIISMFSGGLDSLSGVKWLLDRNIDPILVSHKASPFVSGTQKNAQERTRKSNQKATNHVSGKC